MKLLIESHKWRLILLVLLVAFVVYGLYLVRYILPTFLLAGLLAYLLNPLVAYMEKNHIQRTVAIVLIYFTVLAGGMLIVIMGFPVIVRELNEFAEAIPIYTQQVRQFIQDVQGNYERVDMPESIKEVIDETIAQVEERISQLLAAFAQGIIGLFSRLIYFIIIPVLAFYILKDLGNLERRLLRLFPIKIRNHIESLAKEINVVLKKFIRGHLLVATIVGFLTAISLSLLGVEFAMTLGIIAGIADLIPYFGPIIGIIPAVMVGLLESKVLAIKIVVVMILIQQIESNIISPKIMGDSVGLHPLSIIFVLLAGGHLFGIVGMLLAVPTTAIARTILIYCYQQTID